MIISPLTFTGIQFRFVTATELHSCNFLLGLITGAENIIPLNLCYFYKIKSSVFIIVFIHFLFHIPEGSRKDACNDHQHDPQDNIRGGTGLRIASLPLA